MNQDNREEKKCCDKCWTTYTTDDWPAHEIVDACINQTCPCHTPTETDIEAELKRVCNEIKEVYGYIQLRTKRHNPGTYINIPYWELHRILRAFLTHQHTEHAKEMIEIVENAADHIINEIKSIENPPEAQTAITHNGGFIYGVEALRDDIKAIALSKNIKI